MQGPGSPPETLKADQLSRYLLAYCAYLSTGERLQCPVNIRKVLFSPIVSFIRSFDWKRPLGLSVKACPRSQEMG